MEPTEVVENSASQSLVAVSGRSTTVPEASKVRVIFLSLPVIPVSEYSIVGLKTKGPSLGFKGLRSAHSFMYAIQSLEHGIPQIPRRTTGRLSLGRRVSTPPLVSGASPKLTPCALLWVLMPSDVTTYYEDRNTQGTEKVGQEVELRTCSLGVRGVVWMLGI